MSVKVNTEPLVFGRTLHLVSSLIKSASLGASVKERIWAGVVVKGKWWNEFAHATSSVPPAATPLASEEDPLLTLHIATGSVQIKSFWGNEATDVISFDSSTTCMQRFDVTTSSNPLTLLGCVENFKLTDLTDFGRPAYREIISALKTPGQRGREPGGVTLEWTFSGATANRQSPTTFGIRVKGMRFIYAQRKVMENLFYWQKWFCAHFKLLPARPEDVLGGSIIESIASLKKHTWIQGSLGGGKKFRGDKHPGWRAHKEYQHTR
jgi:hypothetical protein